MVTWVGFELLPSSYQLGISQRSLSSGHVPQPCKRQSTWPSLRRVWEWSCA